MAAQIDGIVAVCTGRVSAAALAARAEVIRVGQEQQRQIASQASAGHAEMASRGETVRASVVSSLTKDAAGPIRAAHDALVAQYSAKVGAVRTILPAMADGTAPQPIPGGPATPPAARTPPGPHTTFGAAGTAIVATLQAESDAGDHVTKYINANKIRVTGLEATGMTGDWRRAAAARAETYDSADARNRFVITALGLVAPTIEAAENDQLKYQDTVEADVRKKFAGIDAGQAAAITRIEAMLFAPGAVNQAFDPSIPKSLPAQINRGLIENSAKIKEALLIQALTLQAGFRAGIAEMARAYPDVLTRIEALLEGEDLLDERMMVPRVKDAEDSVYQMNEAHVGNLRTQAAAALREVRSGFADQVSGLLQATQGGIDSLVEARQKGVFQATLIGAEYSGVFSADLTRALEAVRGHADQAARQMLAPVQAAGAAGSLVEQRAVAQLNGQMQGEWAGYLGSVNGLGKALGLTEGADTSPFKQIESTERADLNQRNRDAVSALGVGQQVSAGEAGAVAAVSVVAVPVVGWVAAGAGAAYLGYRYYRANTPDIERIQTAISLPWPGALAVNEINQSNGSLPDLITEKIDEDDSERQHLLDQFSENRSTAVVGKARMAVNAEGGLFTINDATVLTLTKSFTPEELALLTPESQVILRNSVTNNLDGLFSRTDDSRMAEQYLSGHPERAVLVGVMSDMAAARRGGDAGMQSFAASMDRRLQQELSRGGNRYVSPRELQALTENVFLAFAENLPPQGIDGRSVPLPPLPSDAAAAKAAPGSREAKVHAARAAFAAYATRDYARMAMLEDNGLGLGLGVLSVTSGGTLAGLGMLGQAAQATGLLSTAKGDDRIAAFAMEELAKGGVRPSTTDMGDGRRMAAGGVILEGMSANTAAMLNAYIMEGSQSEAYTTAAALQALEVGQSRRWGASEADTVRLHQTFGSPRLAIATAHVEEAEAELSAARTDAARRTAQARLDTARAAQSAERRDHDLFLVRAAAGITGQPAPTEPTAEQIAAARSLVASRVGSTAASFDSDMARMGQDLVDRGQIDLGTGLRVATAGAGTHDALLTEVSANRTRFETDRYFNSDQARRDDITRRNLGAVTDNHWYSFSETSGDDAFNLMLALEGIPETPLAKAEQSRRRSQHQVVTGTGFLSEMSMSGTIEKSELQANERALSSRLQIAIAANKRTDDPVPDWLRNLPPDQYFGPDGRMIPELSRYAVDGNGALYGEGPNLADLSNRIDLSAQAYQDEVGRQEAFFTSLITAAALIVAVALMFIPGVNLVVAGILTAVIAGAATMAVKAGFRGGRYGWEEAATDVGRTAIEAATAGIGGALGRGAMAAQKGLTVGGRVAGIGMRLEAGMARALGKGLAGRAAGAAVRESLTTAMSGVANQALDDKIWENGIGSGLGSLFYAGLRGGVTGLISGGGAEVLTGGLRGLSQLGEKGASGRLRTFATRFAGNEVVQEALSNAGALVASEAAGALLDLAAGQSRESFDQFLKRLGPATLRELLSSGSKTAVRQHMQKAYHAERSRLLGSPTPPSAADLRHLNRLAISAGEAQYGRQQAEVDVQTHGRVAQLVSSDTAFARDFAAARTRLGQYPPDMAPALARLAPEDLHVIEAMRQAGAALAPDAHAAEVQRLAQKYPGLDAAKLMDGVAGVIRADAEQSSAVEAQAKAEAAVQKALFAGLPPDVREILGRIPVAALTGLPPALRAEAKALIANGDPDGAGVAALVARAGGDAVMAKQLTDLVAARPQVEAAAAARTTALRDDLKTLLPGLDDALSALPPKDVAFLHRSLTSGGGLPPGTQAHLARMLAGRAQGVAEQDIAAHLSGAADRAAARALAARTAESTAEAARRAPLLAHLPEALRSLLSSLPDDALVELRLAQSMREPLSDARLADMIARTPGADQHALGNAIKAAAALPMDRRPYGERFRQRRALLASVPSELRDLVRQTPILSLDDAAFAAFVRAHPEAAGGPQDNAVTVRLGDKVVVVVRNGASALALREEGLHVLQQHDLAWQPRLAASDEQRLANWDNLSVGERLSAWRDVTAAEIDVHLRMQAGLARESQGAWTGKGRARAAADLAKIEARLAGLHARLAQIDGMSPAHRQAMEAGLAPRFQFLDQPARLFNTDPGALKTDADIDNWMAGIGIAPKQTAAGVAAKSKAPAVTLVSPAAPSTASIAALQRRFADAVQPRGRTKGRTTRQKADVSQVFNAISRMPPEVQNAMVAMLNAVYPGPPAIATPEIANRARIFMMSIVREGVLRVLDPSKAGTAGSSSDHNQMAALLLRRMAADLMSDAHDYSSVPVVRGVVADFRDMLEAMRAIKPDSLAGHTRRALARFIISEEARVPDPATDSTRRALVKRRALIDFLTAAAHVSTAPGIELRMAYLARQHLESPIPPHLIGLLAGGPPGTFKDPNDPDGVFRTPTGVAVIYNKFGDPRPVSDMADPARNAGDLPNHHGNEVGRWAEVVSDKHVREKEGWVRLHPPGDLKMDDAFRGAGQIDMIYMIPGKPVRYVIVDAKGLGATLGDTADGRQMSVSWILARLDATALTKEQKAAIRRQLRDPTIQTSHLLHVDAYGTVTIMNLNANGDRVP